MSEFAQVIREWRQAGDQGGTPQPCATPTILTLFVAVRVNNHIQADGHGMVTEDAGRGGKVRPAGSLPIPLWERTQQARGTHTQGPLQPSHQPHLFQHLYHSLSRLYLPYLGQASNFIIPCCPHCMRLRLNTHQPVPQSSRNGHLTQAWQISTFHSSSHRDWFSDGTIQQAWP